MTICLTSTRILMIAAGWLAALAALAGSAHAAQNCAPRDLVVARLAQIYGESRRSIGLGANASVVEMFASTETGTWTITVTSPNGVTCLAASGEAFEAMPDMLPAKGTDA